MRGGTWQRHGQMGGDVQKWFTGPGLVSSIAMSVTRNSISPSFCAALAAVAALALAGPAAAGSFGSALPSQDAAAAAPADTAGMAGQLPGIAAPDVTAPDVAVPADVVAQYSPVPPRGRPVSDHDHARESTRAGENRGFEELMRSAQSRGRGEYLGVEPDISRNVYRFKFLRSGGNVVWVDVDGRTGRVIAERD